MSKRSSALKLVKGALEELKAPSSFKSSVTRHFQGASEPFPIISVAGVHRKSEDGFYIVCRVLNANGTMVEFPIQCSEDLYYAASATLSFVSQASGLSTLSPAISESLH